MIWLLFVYLKMEVIKMTKMNGYDIYGGASGGASLKGIVKFEKNEQGIVGLEIPDLLSINNYKVDATGTEVLPTNGNLCLRDYTADLLRADNPNIISLTYLKEITYGQDNNIKLYKDSQDLIYGIAYLNTPTGEKGLQFAGGYDESSTTHPFDVEINVAPEWTSESIFQYSDTGNIEELKLVNNLLFVTEKNSTIHIPKTIIAFNPGIKNFSGTIDLSSCTLVQTSERIVTTNFINCTNGTLLLNATQYTAVSSRISEGMLDGKIKVQQKVESEGGGES